MSPEIGLLVAGLLLLGNAFFVGAEFSLISVRRSTIEPKAAKGSRSASVTLRALENLSHLMAGAQLGITLCSLGLGAVAEPVIAHILEGPFRELGVSDQLLHPLSFAIALVTTVFLHVVIGEMVPKNIALAKPERSALILAPALVSVLKILNPVVHMLNWMANMILRSAGVRPSTEVASTYTRDEMADLVKESQKEGLLSDDNGTLLSGALSFDNQTVHDIAMPANEMVTIDRTATYGSVEELAARTNFSRFPVADKKNQMVGYVHIKDIIKVDPGKRKDKVDKKYIRKLVDVNGAQSIRMTLKIMQRSGAHMALVHKGKTGVGLVTLEDVLEELVGEISSSSKADKK
jgi:CBS domain containing-hemolysin-like protein